jgi:transposase
MSRIDWADRKHDVCLQVPGVDAVEASVVEHKPKAIEEWAHKLRDRFAGQRIAVCLELSHGPIVSALLEHDFFVIFPVNPSTLAKYRRAFTPSRAKDDPTDAAIALELLRRHREKLKPLRHESPNMRALRRLVEARRDLVQDRVRLPLATPHRHCTFELIPTYPRVRRGRAMCARCSYSPEHELHSCPSAGNSSGDLRSVQAADIRLVLFSKPRAEAEGARLGIELDI